MYHIQCFSGRLQLCNVQLVDSLPFLKLRKRIKKAIVDNKRLKRKLDNATSESGIVVDSQLENDVLSFISKNNDKANEFAVGAQDEFRKIFWEQQVHCVHCTSNYVCILLRLYTSLGHSYYVGPGVHSLP